MYEAIQHIERLKSRKERVHQLSDFQRSILLHQ